MSVHSPSVVVVDIAGKAGYTDWQAVDPTVLVAPMGEVDRDKVDTVPVEVGAVAVVDHRDYLLSQDRGRQVVGREVVPALADLAIPDWEAVPGIGVRQDTEGMGHYKDVLLAALVADP